MRNPDFSQMQRVLRRERPDRPVLFELFMNLPLYELVNGRPLRDASPLGVLRFTAEAFRRMGYDYVTAHASAFAFPQAERQRGHTVSLNGKGVITDEASFDAYRWPDVDGYDDSAIRNIAPDLPEGMKLMVMGPGGVLENVTAIVGYDTLCLMLYDEPELAGRIFDAVGERIYQYYARIVREDTVGFLVLNDDWGFNRQTFLSPAMMRQYVFPWHKKVIDLCHGAGKPVVLHSCGACHEIMEDIVALGFDGKHSFEDKIQPVEDVYDAWHERIAIIGGMDMDFMCRAEPGDIAVRVKRMLARTNQGEGWAVGTGNSVPEYVPVKSFFALIEAATGERVDIG